MHKALGIGVLVIAASFGAFLAATPPARAADVYFDLYGSTAGGWGRTSGGETNPGPTFATQSGDQVHLNLTSDDGFDHTFHLDLDGDNLTGPAEPLSGVFNATTGTITYSFSAPPGNYWYLCSIHGFGLMSGVWIVATPGTDTTPPSIASVSVTPANPVVNDTVTITASVTDNIAVASVSANVTWPDATYENLTMGPGAGTTWVVDRVVNQTGTYTVTIWARDNAGNNASASTTFTVSTSPPGDGTPPADNTGLWAAVAGVVIILFLLVALAMWRRGAKKAEPPRKEEPPET